MCAIAFNPAKLFKLASTKGPHPMPWTPEEQEVLDVLHGEWRAFYAGDFEAFASFWAHTPEVRRMASGPNRGTSLISGWEALSAQIREVLRQYPQDFVAEEMLRWDDLRLQVSGDIAWATYDQVTLKKDDRLLAPLLSHEVKILNRTREGWKIVLLSAVVPAIGRDDVPQIEIGFDGKVSRINRLARERLVDHPGLVLSGDRLRARRRALDPDFQAELARWVAERGLLPPHRMTFGSRAWLLGVDDSGRPLYCWISAEQEKVLVTFDDAARMKSRLEVAANIFALSPAQLALCELLAEGADLNGAADALGVSVNTLRTQLRRMFDKTGTRSQTALISALLTVRQPR